MKYKKMLIEVLSLIGFSYMSLVLAACQYDNSENISSESSDSSNSSLESSLPEHIHEWNEGEVTKEATCTLEGEITFSCNYCEEIKFESIPAIGHEEVIIEGIEATCVTTGLSEGKYCSRCEMTLVYQQSIPVTPHQEVIIEGKKSTCTESGLTEGKYCSECGQTLIYQQVIPAHGHKEEKQEKEEPTCTSTGLTEGSYCSECNEILVQQKEIAALGHYEVVDKEVAPTCTNVGFTEGSHCDRCNEVIVKQEEVLALGHEECVDNAVEPSCTSTGLTEGIHCNRCNEIIVEQEIVDALGHNETIIEKVDATCTQNGLTEGSICLRCFEVLIEQEIIPAYGHEFEDNTCINCGQISATEGLEYELSSDETYYSIVGIGTATDVEIIIPETYNGLPVKGIEESAFDCLENVKSITISKEIDYINEYAFYACYDLVNIYVASENTFFKSLDGVLFSFDETRLIYYPIGRTQDTYIIPEKVKELGTYAFAECNFSSIFIPDNVEIIGEGCFAGSHFVKSIQIGDTTNNKDNSIFVFDAAFNDCVNVEEIYIYHSKIIIDEAEAFYYMDNLESIFVGPNVSYIDQKDFWFAESYNLSSLVVDENNKSYDSRNNCNAIIETSSNTLILGCQNTIVPEDITTIGPTAFYNCKNLKEIYLPNSIQEIGEGAFGGCSLLTNIELPQNIDKISESLFTRCSSLKSITIPEGVTIIDNYAFDDCEQLKEIYIPNTVTSIGFCALDRTNLKDVYYSGSKEEWDSIYIGYNGSLYEATIHFSEDNSVDYTEGLEFSLNIDEESYQVRKGNATGTTIIIPETYEGLPVTKIAVHAFSNFTELENIVLPNTIQTIEYSAFANTSLTSISLPESLNYIHDFVFGNCDLLTSVYIPSGVSYISSSAFNGCDYLTNIIVDNDNPIYDSRYSCNAIIETASNILVVGCSNTSIPNDVVEIAEEAFRELETLTSIDIPNNITKIGERAFEYCFSLTSVTISENVNDIGDFAFLGCESLAYISIDSDNKFYDSRNNCNGIIETSTNTLVFGGINTIIPDSVTCIGVGAFAGCSSLTSVVIPSSIVAIDDWIFEDCSSLVTVYYTGTEEQWNNIVIGDNYELSNVTIIYNYEG